MNKIGSRIKAARLHKGLKREELAAMIGICQSYEWSIENDLVAARVSLLPKIAESCGVSMAYLLEGKEATPNAEYCLLQRKLAATEVEVLRLRLKICMLSNGCSRCLVLRCKWFDNGLGCLGVGKYLRTP